MRATICRGLGFGALLIGFVQASAVAQAPTPYQKLTAEPTDQLQWKSAVAQLPTTAQPPETKKPATLPIPTGLGATDDQAIARLRADVAALIGSQKEPVASPPTSTSADRARLLGQLDELLKRLNSQPPGGMPSSRPPITPPTPKTKFEFGDGQPIDTLRMAMNLFRDGDFDAALRAFRLIQPTQLPPEDRRFVQYMTASSLRRLGRLSEAAVLYREVAESTEDEFLATSAVTQLNLMRNAQELEAQLEQLRARPKGR